MSESAYFKITYTVWYISYLFVCIIFKKSDKKENINYVKMLLNDKSKKSFIYF